MENVQNPGSALGENNRGTNGNRVNTPPHKVVNKYSCRLISKGKKTENEKATKLLLYDNFGTAYNMTQLLPTINTTINSR